MRVVDRGPAAQKRKDERRELREAHPNVDDIRLEVRKHAGELPPGEDIRGLQKGSCPARRPEAIDIRITAGGAILTGRTAEDPRVVPPCPQSIPQVQRRDFHATIRCSVVVGEKHSHGSDAIR